VRRARVSKKVRGLGVAAIFLVVYSLSGISVLAGEMPMAAKGMGKFFDTHKSGDTIEAAIQRGQEVFNKLGCAGCHPRGGTIGGTAVTSTGMRMPVPIPQLIGAAIHFPRMATPKGIAVDLGMMNDL